MSKKILIAAAILLTSGLAHADRSKFYLAGGLGYEANTLTSDTNGNEAVFDTKAGVVGSIKIGGLITQKHAIYLHRQASWFSFDNNTTTDINATSDIIGIGYTYYMSSTVGSPYIEASYGLGRFIEDVLSTEFNGPAFMIGAGYELSKHIQVGSSFQHSSTSNSDIPNFVVNYNSLAAKVELKF